jgi:DNA-binding MarR family transcriptional regulator
MLSFTTLNRPPPVKGASGHVLQLLRECAVHGMCTISIESMSNLTGYCPMTIKKAIRRLIDHKLIEVSKVYGDRRNCYRVREPDVSQTPA